MKGTGNNRTGWHSEEFERLLAQAAETGKPQDRYDILSQAESLFLKERPILPVYWYTRNYLLRPEVKGWHPLVLDNHPYKFMRLESSPTMKKEG